MKIYLIKFDVPGGQPFYMACYAHSRKQAIKQFWADNTAEIDMRTYNWQVMFYPTVIGHNSNMRVRWIKSGPMWDGKHG